MGGAATRHDRRRTWGGDKAAGVGGEEPVAGRSCRRPPPARPQITQVRGLAGRGWAGGFSRPATQARLLYVGRRDLPRLLGRLTRVGGGTAHAGRR